MQDFNEELIPKFFSGLCTQEEADQVLLYLRQHPEHPYLVREWDAADGVTPLPSFYTDNMKQVVMQHTDPLPVKKGRSRWLLAAACIAALVVSAWLWRSGVGRGTTPALVQKAPAAPDWIEQRNNGREQRVLLLPDSSRLTLSPGAQIRYRRSFGTAAARDIYMKGDIFYEVARNRARPFTVYSDWISTTALGTAFRVTAPERGGQIKVRLNEGKVKVAQPGRAGGQDYYLLPGQELVFHSRDSPGVVDSFFVKVNRRKTAAVAASKQEHLDESYLFNNQTLPDVLDQLSVMYGVRFRYVPADLERIYFVGKVERTDSIEKTLADIALLNSLSVKKSGSGFILETRKQHSDQESNKGPESRPVQGRPGPPFTNL